MRNGYILVTGSSRGIGSAVATELSRSGYDLMLHYNRSADGSLKTAEECRKNGSNVILISADLSSSQGIKDLCDQVRKAGVKLKGIVNNAGAGVGDNLLKVTEKDWDTVLGINVKAPLLIVKNLLDLLEENSSIVNMSSAASVRPLPSSISYSASKAALSNLTKALALTLGPSIRVNAVAPGFIDTDMTNYIKNNSKIFDKMMDRTPLKRFGKPEEIARVVRFLLSEDSSFMTGEVIVVDGGITI